jgi:hypothetical protein
MIAELCAAPFDQTFDPGYALRSKGEITHFA